jgi:hypothetical protein
MPNVVGDGLPLSDQTTGCVRQRGSANVPIDSACLDFLPGLLRVTRFAQALRVIERVHRATVTSRNDAVQLGCRLVTVVTLALRVKGKTAKPEASPLRSM